MEQNTPMTNEWVMAQEFEQSWWASCANTFAEETKQLTYAFKMGLVAFSNGGQWPVYDLGGKRILDMGGGPASLLLKCVNLGPATTVLDPCGYPSWTKERYHAAGIGLWQMKAEELTTFVSFSEVWIYNVLQHVEDPEAVIANARRAAPVIRICDWIDTMPCEGHPQSLSAPDLDKWLGGEGTIEQLNENGCYGTAYYGAFTT